MSEKVLGVDFGTTGIKLAEVSRTKDSVTVLKQAFMPLERGQFIAGAPDPEQLLTISQELKSFVAAEKFTAKDAVMSVNAATGVYVNRATTPWHEPKNLRTALGFDLIADRSLLVGAPEGLTIDAVVFDDFVDLDDARKLDLLLCGVSDAVVQDQVTILQKAGLNPVGVEISGLAALRSTWSTQRQPGDLDVLVDIGEEVASILLHESGKPYAYTLNQDISGAAASELVSKALLDDDRERTNREKATISQDYRVNLALDEYIFQVQNAISAAIASYLQRRKTEEATIAGITLIGGGALVNKMRENLQVGLRSRVIVGKFDPAIGGKPERYHLGKILSHDYAVAVGLALGAVS